MKTGTAFPEESAALLTIVKMKAGEYRAYRQNHVPFGAMAARPALPGKKLCQR